MGLHALKRLCCRCGIHCWADKLSDFNWCLWCGKVIWFPGTWYWDLDICDTRKVYNYIQVWP